MSDSGDGVGGVGGVSSASGSHRSKQFIWRCMVMILSIFKEEFHSEHFMKGLLSPWHIDSVIWISRIEAGVVKMRDAMELGPGWNDHRFLKFVRPLPVEIVRRHPQERFGSIYVSHFGFQLRKTTPRRVHQVELKLLTGP